MDFLGKHQINYKGFIAATLEAKFYQNEAIIQAVFNQFDTDHTGKIKEENIEEALAKFG